MYKNYVLSTGTNVKVHLQKKGETSERFNGRNAYHDIYRAILVFKEGKVTTTFHNSIANYGKPLKEEDVDCAVECIIGDALDYKYHPSMNDFFDDFGYDYDDKEGEKVYRGCESIWWRLGKYLTEEEMNELENIVRGINI